MANVDRSLSALKSHLSPVRSRLHAVTAGAAMAFVAGLSVAPAAAAASPADAAAVEQNSVRVQAAATKTIAAVTTKPASPAAKKAVKKPTAPTAEQMHPTGIGGGQEFFTPSPEQLKNAKTIVDAGKKLGLPPRAWVIACGTALQESGMVNLGDLGASNDHDSVGLFQQRPSSGWGTPEQVHDAAYAATAFYKGLVSVPSWNKVPLTEAAQAVQVSAFPDHYAKWEAQAGYLVSAVHGAGPYAKLATSLK